MKSGIFIFLALFFAYMQLNAREDSFRKHYYIKSRTNTCTGWVANNNTCFYGGFVKGQMCPGFFCDRNIYAHKSGIGWSWYLGDRSTKANFGTDISKPNIFFMQYSLNFDYKLISMHRIKSVGFVRSGMVIFGLSDKSNQDTNFYVNRFSLVEPGLLFILGGRKHCDKWQPHFSLSFSYRYVFGGTKDFGNRSDLNSFQIIIGWAWLGSDSFHKGIDGHGHPVDRRNRYDG